MRLEKVKRNFIQFMEQVHGGNPYPRNFYGCLLPIIIEPEPTSQERIMELTGYSQATVSLTIQKIQLLFPIRTVKKVGERRLYYEYPTPNQFILDLTHKRTTVQDLDTIAILPFLEKVKARAAQNLFYKRFFDYLNNLILYLTFIHEIRCDSAESLKKVLEVGTLEGIHIQDTDVLESGTLADFLVKLKHASSVYDFKSLYNEQIPSDYLDTKIEYFSKIKSNFNPLYTQVLANQFIVIHSVILTGCTTQEEIERSTLLPRSTISELLKNALDRGIIKVTTEKGSRIKFYELDILFSDLMLGYFDRAANYIRLMKNRSSEFASEVKAIRPTTPASK
ncbi:MAG: hypothetical protein RTV31_06705, partial [Candidatus Thorarchaeota archaeon]